MKKLLLLLMVSKLALAQMPHDAIYMGPKTYCVAVSVNQSTWSQYWENTLKRENLNMGTHTTQSIMPMVAYGLKKNLNLIVGLPYVKTSTSAGNLMGQKGLQDTSAWLKYKLAESKGISLHAAVGGSIPVSNYVAEFLPMSIGLHSKNLMARAIANYAHKSGVYATAHASYTYRSNVAIDKDGYQADNKIYNTNMVRVPNATDASVRLGWMKNGSRIQAEGFLERFACIGGDNIRRNDMPFLTNNMQMTSAGFYGKFQPKNIGANVRVAKVLNGLNVGQSTSYSLGVLYQINPKK